MQPLGGANVVGDACLGGGWGALLQLPEHTQLWRKSLEERKFDMGGSIRFTNQSYQIPGKTHACIERFNE